MSNPKNPLDVFRSYAYHHILVACDGTNTADSLTSAPLSAYDHPSNKFCPQSLTGAGNYIVLINGMTDAQFYISTAKWSSVMIPRVRGQGQTSASSTMAVDGELQIVEPRGLNFYNLLNQATKSLRIDPSAMVYVLKTIFVGITDVGTEEVISTIRPMPFILTDITSSFSHTGAEYNISFVGMVNGAGKMPHANSIVQGFTGTIPPGSIPEALSYIKDQLNELYRDQRAKTINAASTCGVDRDIVDIENEFMNVEYDIKVSSKYDSYVAGNALPANRQSTGNGDSHISDLGESTSIERIIDEVMRSSKQVLSDLEGEATDDTETSKRKMYKITSDVQIDRSQSKYKVTYYVNQYVGTVVRAEDIETYTPPTGPTGESVGIEFDYIFTGDNIDIIEFDMDMQYGLTFLQMLGTNSSCPTSRLDNKMFGNPDTLVAGIGNKDGAGDQKPPAAGCYNSDQPSDDVVKKPLFLGSMLTHPSFRDTRTPGAAAGFNSLLHRIAALENIGAKMKIRGNPQLLEDSILQRSDLEAAEEMITQSVPNSDRPLIPGTHTIPGYIKVNIMMPRAWQMSETEDLSNPNDYVIADAAGDYASAFWYKGWYMLLQIDHVFSDGEFTQELEIYSLPTDAGQSGIGKCIDEAVFPPKADPGGQTVPAPANTTSTSTNGSAATSTGGAAAESDKTVGSMKLNELAARRNGAGE